MFNAIQLIYEYGKDLVKNDTRGLKKKKICGHLVIDENGVFQRYEPEPNPAYVYCPTLGTKVFAKGASDFLVEKAEVILTVNNDHHAFYVDLIKRCASECEEMMPYAVFLAEYDNNKELQEKIITLCNFDFTKPETFAISVKIGNFAVETQDWWKEWFKKEIDNGFTPVEVISSITGKKALVKEETYPYIFGPGTGTGVPLFSAFGSAYASYGFNPLELSGIDTDSAYIVRDTLEALISDRKHFSHGMMHMCKNSVADDILSYFDDSYSDEDTASFDTELTKEYDSLFTGKSSDIKVDASEPVYTFNLSFPSKGRYQLSHQKEYKYGDLIKNLYKWWKEDTTLVETTYKLTINSIFKNLKVGDEKSVRRALIDAILTDSQIPVELYNSAIHTYTSSFLKKGVGKFTVEVARAIIHIYIKRKYEENN